MRRRVWWGKQAGDDHHDVDVDVDVVVDVVVHVYVGNVGYADNGNGGDDDYGEEGLVGETGR